MSLDFAKDLIDAAFNDRERLAFLGGEPTESPYFNEIFSYAGDRLIETYEEDLERPQNMLLISNFLFTDPSIGETIQKVDERILQFLANVRGVTDIDPRESALGYLLNASEFTQESQFDLFVSNVKKYITSDISPGFTLDITKSPQSYIDKLIRFTEEGILINSLRLSVPNLMAGTTTFSEYRETYFDKIREQIVAISDHIDGLDDEDRYDMHFDCGATVCLFDEDPESKLYYRRFLRSSKLGCGSSALDIKPTGEMISCWPIDFITANIKDYNMDSEAIQGYIRNTQKIQSSYGLPEECKSCKHFMGDCNGPCFALYAKNREEK
jgi:radical SAM protein with 4Fe4S-binding SPASM domain